MDIWHGMVCVGQWSKKRTCARNGASQSVRRRLRSSATDDRRPPPTAAMTTAERRASSVSFVRQVQCCFLCPAARDPPRCSGTLKCLFPWVNWVPFMSLARCRWLLYIVCTCTPYILTIFLYRTLFLPKSYPNLFLLEVTGFITRVSC